MIGKHVLASIFRVGRPALSWPGRPVAVNNRVLALHRLVMIVNLVFRGQILKIMSTYFCNSIKQCALSGASLIHVLSSELLWMLCLTNAVMFRFYSDNPTYNTIPQVFDRIAHVADEEVVKQIGATFHFNIPNESGYYVDLKNGAGAVTKGEPAEKADVTVTMDADNLLK